MLLDIYRHRARRSSHSLVPYTAENLREGENYPVDGFDLKPTTYYNQETTAHILIYFI